MSIRRWIGSLVGADNRAVGSPSGLVRMTPAAATWVVGDIHGCLSLYQDLEQEIVSDGARVRGPKLIVLVGDIVDRGPDSSGVIEHVMGPPPPGFQRVCLLGNHEDMMLRFMDEPVAGHGWLQYGGAETLSSYGVLKDPVRGYAIQPGRLRKLARERIPERHLNFLRKLPHCLETGPYFLSHAGVNPDKPMTAQTKNDLVWARHYTDETCQAPVGLGRRRVIHGHIPVVRVDLSHWHINVDTGACETGRLSAVRLADTGPVHVLGTRNTRQGKQKAGSVPSRLIGTRRAV